MSCNIATLLKSEEKPLDCLKGKTLAIDIMPILYKYLYTTTQDNTILKSPEGLITSHLKGLLFFLKNLKKREINPIVCIDLIPPLVKEETVKKRIETKNKNLEKYERLKENGITLTQKEQKSYLNLKTFVGLTEKQLILKALSYLGITTYQINYVEAEKAAAGLKKAGLADQVYSLDRDLILYGTSFYSKIDFQKETVLYYSYEKNLKNLDLTPDAFFLAAIACGTDYSKGIFKVGPKTALRKIKENKESFELLLKKEVSNYAEIHKYLKEDIALSPQFFLEKKKDPIAFVKFLQELGFSEKLVLSLSSFFF